MSQADMIIYRDLEYSTVIFPSPQHRKTIGFIPFTKPAVPGPRVAETVFESGVTGRTQVTGQMAVPPGGSATPGATAGFRLSREDMAAELKNLYKLQIRINVLISDARPLWVVPPGQDPASLRNTDAVNNSFNLYRRHLECENDYLFNVIHKMEEALGIHQMNDQQASDDVNQVGQGPI